MAVYVKDISRPKKRHGAAKAPAATAPTPRQVAGRIGSALRRAYALAANGGYKVVSGRDQLNRTFVRAETGDEFKQLTITDRNRIVAFARKLVRNSDQMESILHQFEVQVVGTVGGKAVFDFGSEEIEDPKEAQMTAAFAEWTSECEFFDDSDLNTLLKLALRTQIIGGDIVLVFDDNLVSDSGQVIVFEPDCIGNIPDSDFKRLFPGCSQEQGIIKDANSKTVGAIVSWSQRGQSVYQLKTPDGRMAAWPLVKEPGTSWKDSLFVLHRNIWRFNQGRGSSGLWAALATLCDLTDLQGYEIQSAKKNSQTLGQVVSTEEQKDASIDPNYNPDVTAPVNGGDAQADTSEADEGVDADFEVLKAAGCIYELMPKNVKYELFDTKHPNANMPQFISWLQRVAAYTLGLSSFHATGKADSSYSAAMAEIQLSQKSFNDAWQKLERSILDWLIRRWTAWALRHGRFPVPIASLPADWQRTCVTWERPRQNALNPVDEQRAFSEGLRNGSISYADVHGANWKRAMKQHVREKNYAIALGLRYFPETDNNGMNPNPENTSQEKEENK